MKRILVADDHVIFREGLKQFIAGIGDMCVTGEAENGLDVLSKVRANDYDLVILDVSLPGKNGLDVLADIKRMKPNLPVLILSMYPEEQFGLRALQAGAAGYLAKGKPSQDLLTALRRIAGGKRYVSPALAEELIDNYQHAGDRPLHESLSAREYQVACMISAGKKPRQIADELAMSVKTVGSYRARIFSKMHLSSNAELVRYATEQHLI